MSAHCRSSRISRRAKVPNKQSIIVSSGLYSQDSVNEEGRDKARFFMEVLRDPNTCLQRSAG